MGALAARMAMIGYACLMTNDPLTCAICGALITEERGGELVRLPGHDGLVWVHPSCKGRPVPSSADDPEPIEPSGGESIP